MKTSQSRKFPLEIGGINAGTLTISIAVDNSYLSLLEQKGFGAQELHNYTRDLIFRARDAMDGSVPGLIIGTPDLEE